MTSGRNARPRFLLALLLLAIASSPLLRGQASSSSSGEIRGKVTNSLNSEGLVRASVAVVGTKLGAYSDLNGVFSIRNLPPGRYTLRVKYVGFEIKDITDVEVSGSVTIVDVLLRPKKNQGDTVVVTARRGTGTAAALLNQQQSSANVQNGISLAEVRRLPDATGAEALARVSGVTTLGSKFVQIRGAGERYNNTQLNGVTLASTEPGKRAFSFDLVPSNLLENSIVVKTFTPDLPGDFSGGLVRMQTVDFPDERTLRLSLSSSYRAGTTFNDLSFAPRGSTDFVAIDDGARALPAAFGDTARITKESYTPQQRADLARLLPNSYRLEPVVASPSLGLVASYGDRFEFDAGYNLGVIAALSYHTGFEQTVISRFHKAVFDYSGTENQYSTLWGGLINLTAKINGLNTISLKNLYNRSAEDNFTAVSGTLLTADYENHPYTYQYLQRSFYSGQLIGDHIFPQFNSARFSWRGFASFGTRDEPDYRRISNGRNEADSSAPLRTTLSSFLPNAYGAGRVYSKLNEEIFGLGGDLTLPFGDLKVKIGSVVENKTRSFTARSFAYMLNDSTRDLAFSGLDTLFDASHIRSDALSIVETTQKSDNYDGQSHLRAGYAMIDLPFEVMGERFRTIVGARYEDSRVEIHTVDPNSKPLTVNYPTYDWLPSLNLTWVATPAINFRLAYSRTVARPDFREYARYVFYDFIQDALTYGNPELHRTLISNYDARIEFFPEVGELFAVSLFQKRFTDAIEEVGLNGNSPERTWANADAVNTGIELEARKGLGFLTDVLDGFSVSLNYTWLDSKVNVDSTRGTNATERSLQGQSPFIANIAIFFDSPETGTSATVAWNTFGRRLVRIGRNEEPNYVEEPRDRIDFTVSQAILGSLELKLSIKDLLEQDVVLTQYEGEKPAEVNKGERSISLGLSARF